MEFREHLRGLRESVGATFAQLDRVLGRTNQVARIERRELPIPDRQTIVQLGEALRELGADTSGERLWDRAAPERADPDVRAFYEAKLSEQRATFERREGAAVGLSESVAELVLLLGVMQGVMDRVSNRSPGATATDLAGEMRTSMVRVFVDMAEDIAGPEASAEKLDAARGAILRVFFEADRAGGGAEARASGLFRDLFLDQIPASSAELLRAYLESEGLLGEEP